MEKQTIQIKFKDFLASCEDYEGEVYADHLEDNRHSFSWDKESQITKKGEQQFSKIMNSGIAVVKGNIKLLDENITQKEYDLWMDAVAGYVGVSVYNEWFEEVKKDEEVGNR